MLNKAEQKNIIDTIENLYNPKIEKLTEEKNAAIEQKNIIKEKLTSTETENKELKAKVKALEKELTESKKAVAKYEKILNQLKQ